MKILKQTLVALAFGLFGLVALAQIPVTDGAHIGQTVFNGLEQVMKWMEQYKQMESQIKQMEQQFQSMTGSRGMGVIPDPLKDQLKSIMTNPPNVEQFRKNYPTLENAPKANAYYDIMATGDAKTKALYDLMEKRMEQVQSLSQKIDSASDQAAKLDLMNRIASEQAAIQAAEGLMKTAIQTHEAELRQADFEVRKERRCQLFKC